MKHWMTSAVSPLVAFLSYDALSMFLDLATEGATDPPKVGPRQSLPTDQIRVTLDDQASLLVAAAPPPERTSAPAVAGKDAPPCSLSQRCQGIPLPGKPESAPLATLDLEHTTAPRATWASDDPNSAAACLPMASAAGGAHAPREIAMALTGLALEVVDPPG